MSAMFYAKIGIEVGKTDNGYILEWKNEELPMEPFASAFTKKKERGVEVHTDKKKLLKRIDQLL